MLKALLGKTIEVNAAKKAYEPEDKPRRTKVIQSVHKVQPFHKAKTEVHTAGIFPILTAMYMYRSWRPWARRRGRRR
jgi:hypothetical protein